ncbi:MAG: hypothetical protein A2992_03285 [Elusimicrobia bacterium RIFCSPLOWO2_01_FULL_59_12]|nr:MAG: hypothetical protein A2992_03285 [Elusimicrobia bacterium RIFCSPLOWO2_01_FULL_59_12]
MGVRLAPLVWTIRCAAGLGLTALTLTAEISQAYLCACWAAWGLSFWLDRQPGWGHRLRRLETAAVIALISVFLLDFFFWGHAIFICVAHFLLLFQLFKLLGPKERKDCLQILVFSFFQVLSACTLSVDVWQAVILLLLIPTAVAGLFWQQISRDVEDSGQPLPAEVPRSYHRWVAGICLGAIPVNLFLATALFIIFPRLAFRNAFAGLGAGRSGYNEQVNLAQAGVLNLDNSAVLWMQITPAKDRARWKGYLRGTTLDVFDGRKWGRSGVQVSQTLHSDTHGVFKFGSRHGKDRDGLRQTITLVNTSGATLFGSPFMGEAVAPFATLQYMIDGSVRWAIGWRKPLHYRVVSFDQPLAQRAVPASAPAGTAPVPRAKDPGAAHGPDYLQLPRLPLKRTRILLRQITAGRRTPGRQAKAIESYLKGTYVYSLDQGARPAENPVEDFLFVRRRGPCGHFASAMAVMLRLQGIPARVAAGYYQGTWNSRLEQYLFRERDAHAWVEAYLPDAGWVLFDPSPRVSPPRIAQRWLRRLQENWEVLNFKWNQLVIEYDLYSQVKTLQDIQSNTHRMNAAISGWIDKHLMGSRRRGGPFGESSESEEPTGRSLPWAPMLAAVILASVLGLWRIRTHSAAADPAIAFYKKFLVRMARKGFPKHPSETGWEYAERLRQRPGSGTVFKITEQYYRTRFQRPTA